MTTCHQFIHSVHSYSNTVATFPLTRCPPLSIQRRWQLVIINVLFFNDLAFNIYRQFKYINFWFYFILPSYNWAVCTRVVCTQSYYFHI